MTPFYRSRNTVLHFTFTTLPAHDGLLTPRSYTRTGYEGLRSRTLLQGNVTVLWQATLWLGLQLRKRRRLYSHLWSELFMSSLLNAKNCLATQRNERSIPTIVVNNKKLTWKTHTQRMWMASLEAALWMLFAFLSEISGEKLILGRNL